MKIVLLTLAITLAILAIACSSGEEQAEEQTASDEEPSTASQPDEFALITSEVSPDGLKVIFGTPDLGVGENRFGFVLTSSTELVRDAAAGVTTYYYPDEGSEGEPKETAVAIFRPWPYGTRGLYTTQLTLDRPGRWRVDIKTLDPEGPARRAQLFFEVDETTSAPAVGSPALKSINKTIRDVGRLSQLTTGSLQDPDLYQTTIADAVASGMPTVLVVASPAFCTNAVCGPQVEVLQQLKDKYKGRANFIHVDFYDNPEGIQGDLTKARVSPTASDWGLPSTEWSFVIDRDGVIAGRFESFATLQELEQSLLEVL